MVSITKNSIFQMLCFLFVACIPLTWATTFWGSAYRLVTIVLFAVFLLAACDGMKTRIKHEKIVLCWTVYLLYIAIMIPVAVHIRIAGNSVVGMLLVYVIVFVFAVTDWTDGKRRMLDTVWIIVGLVCAMMYLLGSKTSVGEYGDRTTLVVLGTPTDPNEFSGVFIAPVALCCYRIFAEKGFWKKLLYFAIVVTEVMVLFLCGSRGALLSVLFAVAITVLFLPRKKLGRYFVIMAYVTLATFIVAQFVLPMIPESVLQRFSLETLVESGGGDRANIWKEGFRAYSEGSLLHMIFGYGPQGMNVERTTMHNQLLQVLVDYGVIGVILFVSLLWNSLKKFYRHNRRYLGAYLGMLLLSMTLTMPASYKPLWLLMMMALVTVD